MKRHRRFAHALMLIIFVAGVIGLSGAQATSTDLVELHVSAPSIDGSVWFARGDGARWRLPCPNSGRPSHGRCLVRVERGTTVILTPQDGAISKFQRWEQPCNVTGTTCTVQVNEDVVQVTGRFSPLRLWFPSLGPGRITVLRTESGQPGRPCGPECLDFTNGEKVTLWVKVAGGDRFTGWSGACASVPRKYACRIPMTTNRMVAASFEPPPPPPPPPGESPVTVPQKFSILFTAGRGTVVAGKMGNYGPDSCSIQCVLWRTKGKWVELKARSDNPGGSVTWGGPPGCRGNGTCQFKNRAVGGKAPTILVSFR
jgi:Divergent InlB B-repeat domain